MTIQQYSVRTIVDHAVSNKFGMPEFQRGFVWTPAKVMDLVVSLFRDYPVGALLLWEQPSEDALAPGRVSDGGQPDVWVVDGQQRTTAMCLLFGRKPYWWQGGDNEWNAACDRYDIHVSPLADAQFEIPKRSIIRNSNYISVRRILNADDSQLDDIAASLHEINPQVRSISIVRVLERIREIGSHQIVAFVEDKDLEDTVESFVRLNQSGTKVNEGDIFRAQVAARNSNWVTRTFVPFLDELEDSGFGVEPTLIFRSLIAVGTGATRFRNVSRDFWQNEQLNQQWPKVESGWRTIVARLNRHGILNSDILPSKNALIPLVVMATRFERDFRIEPALAWLLRATCTNRYNRTTDTRLGEDIRVIRGEKDFTTAIQQAFKNLEPLNFTADENEYFKRSYRDGGVQLMLYLLAYANEAHDWSSSKERIGYAGVELLQKFNPEWHHIFPRAYLRGKSQFARLDWAANVAVIRKETNLQIGKKSPMEYMEGISDRLLREQYVPTDRDLFTVARYDEFLEQRAELLANAAHEFMSKLEHSLPGSEIAAA